jgi:hypothetical protein
MQYEVFLVTYGNVLITSCLFFLSYDLSQMLAVFADRLWHWSDSSPKITWQLDKNYEVVILNATIPAFFK